MSEAHQDEIFVIPRGAGTWFLYAPLRRAVAVVNAAVCETVAAYLETGIEGLNPQAREVIEELESRGLLGGEMPAPPVFPDNYDFCPHEVTLFPTSRCNLRCRYCYADAGHKDVDMPWEVARAAIDLVSGNAGLLGSRHFGIGFHGGGEPTMAWDMIVRCVEHARARAEDLGLDFEVFCATNGVLSTEQREFIAANFTDLNVSLDGPADVQDRNRPLPSGGSSYERVRESLEYFDTVGFSYGFRATITEATVSRMPEIVERLCSDFNPAYLHVEPAWFCGRCLSSGEAPPADTAFIENFVAAVRRGEELGVKVHYSGARLDVLTSKFCAAPGDGFSVLPEGIATSCYEVTEQSDPRADIFHYGHYDAAAGRFLFDQERLAALRKLSVENLPFCADCFCKWHCAGDCLSKVFGRGGTINHEGSSRCRLNRALTVAELEALVAAEAPTSTWTKTVGA